MSLMPKQPCLRCKPLVERLQREADRSSRMGGFSAAVKMISDLIAEDPASFLDGLPPEVRTALVREAVKRDGAPA